MHAPEIIVRQFRLGRLAEGVDANAERGRIPEHVLGGPVLARRVDALHHDQKRLLLLGVQRVLQVIDRPRIGLQRGLGVLLVLEQLLVARRKISEFELLPSVGLRQRRGLHLLVARLIGHTRLLQSLSGPAPTLAQVSPLPKRKRAARRQTALSSVSDRETYEE